MGRVDITSDAFRPAQHPAVPQRIHEQDIVANSIAISKPLKRRESGWSRVNTVFGDMNQYHPTWGKGLREIDYYFGPDMKLRTKRLINRTCKIEEKPPVRPLLTLLLEMIKTFKAYKHSPQSETNPFDFQACLLREMMNKDGGEAENDRCNRTNEDDTNAMEERKREQYGGHSERITQMLSLTVKQRVHDKTRYIIRKILFENSEYVDLLLECPMLLEEEINRCLGCSKAKKTSRRRRGSSINKKAKTGSKASFNVEKVQLAVTLR